MTTRSHQRKPMPDPRPCPYCGRVYQPYRHAQEVCRECNRAAVNDRVAVATNAQGQGATWVRCKADDPGGLYRAGHDYWASLVRRDLAAGYARRDSFDWGEAEA